MNYEINFLPFPFFDFKKERSVLKKYNKYSKIDDLEFILKSRTIFSGGFLIKSFDFGDFNFKLKEVIENAKKELRIKDFDLKVNDYIGIEEEYKKIIIKEMKNLNINKESKYLFRLVIYKDHIDLIFDLIGKKDLSYRFYLLKREINPLLASNIFYNLDVEGKKIAFLKCKYAIFPIEFIYSYSLIPGSYRREDLILFDFFDLKEEIYKFNLKNPNFEIFCLNDNSLEVDLARKTARIAKVEDFINFSRTDLFWVDWKFEEKELDYIFILTDKDKEIEDFFYQASYISEKSVIITSKEEQAIYWAERYGLKKFKEFKTKKYKILIFK